MIPDNVTLIVKAPNQQIEDQNIECQSTWTVRQLKGHLAEVYPSKPRTEEQKIIYSGQLLEDNTILKDVLRTYESQIAHTMHLVCSPNKRMPPPQKPQQPVEPTADGLRQRNVPTTNVTPVPTPTEPRPEMRQNDQNHNVEMQNYLSSFVNNYGRVPPYLNYNLGEGYLPVPNDPALLANHMIMMQQAYIQYMQQYANMWQATTTVPGAPVGTGPGVTAEPPPAAAAPPVVGGGGEEEEGQAQDWLEQVYAASRLAILLSLVYLYGSPARLLLVLLLAAAGYLHQIGFFRDLHANHEAARPDNQPNNQNQPDNQNQPANLNQPANPNQPDNQNQPANPIQPANQNENASNQPERQPINPQPVANDQSLLAVGWMIFTSFFASLIPEAN